MSIEPKDRQRGASGRSPTDREARSTKTGSIGVIDRAVAASLLVVTRRSHVAGGSAVVQRATVQLELDQMNVPSLSMLIVRMLAADEAARRREVVDTRIDDALLGVDQGSSIASRLLAGCRRAVDGTPATRPSTSSRSGMFGPAGRIRRRQSGQSG